jgi:serine/threonine protein phosphatase PrpC
LTDEGKTKINQDSRISITSLFEEAFSREDLPVF